MDIQIDGGSQRKGVIVEIDRAPYAYELEIEALIPELLKVSPHHLTWIRSDTPQSRIVALIPDAGVRVDSASSSDPNFTCQLKRKGKRLQLEVSPADLTKRRFGKITVVYQADGKSFERKIPFAVINPPPESNKRKSWLKRLFSDD